MIWQGGVSEMLFDAGLIAFLLLVLFSAQFTPWWWKRRRIRMKVLPNEAMRKLAAERIMRKYKGQEKRLLRLPPGTLRKLIEKEAVKMAMGVNRKERRAAERMARDA